MPKSCPYCGEETNALKNHVRLSSGGGHGPSGRYPDEFQADEAGPPSAEADGGAAAEPVDESESLPDPTDGVNDEPETVNMTPGELDEVVTAAETQGYESGREDAQSDAEAAADFVPVESTVKDTDDEHDVARTFDAPAQGSGGGGLLAGVALAIVAAVAVAVANVIGHGAENENEMNTIGVNGGGL